MGACVSWVAARAVAVDLVPCLTRGIDLDTELLYKVIVEFVGTDLAEGRVLAVLLAVGVLETRWGGCSGGQGEGAVGYDAVA